MGLLPNGVEAALGFLVLPIVVSIGYFCNGRMRRSQGDPNSYQRGGSISSDDKILHRPWSMDSMRRIVVAFQSFFMCKPSSWRVTQQHPAALYVWRIMMIVILLGCYLIVGISFISSVSIYGYGSITLVQSAETSQSSDQSGRYIVCIYLFENFIFILLIFW